MTPTSAFAKTFTSDALDVPLLPKEESNPQQIVVEPRASKVIAALAGTAVPLLSPVFLSHFFLENSEEPPSLLALCWATPIALLLLFQFTFQPIERSLFQVLANYAVASLLVITSFLISDQAFLYVILSSQALLVMVCQSTTTLMMTYSLAAVTWGLLSGVGGQFLVSWALWKDAELAEPMIDNELVCSVVWYIF